MNRFKSSRTKKGLSQKFVALTLGVSVQAVSYWENGSRMPSYENISRLAEMYDVSIDYLLDKTDTPQGDVAQKIPQYDEQMGDFIELYKQLNDADRLTIKNLMKSIQKK